MKPRTLSLFVFVALLGAATAVPALATASEVKLEVNNNCVEPNWPCWATPGSSQPASKVTIASGGSVTFADDKTAANIAWTGNAPMCEPEVPVAPASTKTGWEGKCTFATPGTYRFESSTLFIGDGENYTKYEIVVAGTSTTPPAKEPTKEPAKEPPTKEPTKESPANKEPLPTPTPTGGNPIAITSTTPPAPSQGATTGPPVTPPTTLSTEKATKPLTRAQKLATALKQCKKQPKKKRAQCETNARKLYAPQHKSHKK
jgi:hypothetical protein